MTDQPTLFTGVEWTAKYFKSVGEKVGGAFQDSNRNVLVKPRAGSDGQYRKLQQAMLEGDVLGFEDTRGD